MPEFDNKPAKKPQPKRIPKYELLGTSDRITMAVRGATSVRTQFHNVPLELPPPPGVRNLFTYEHSYCNSTSTK